METLQERFLLKEKVKHNLFSVMWDVTFSIQFYFAVVLYCLHLKNRSYGLHTYVSCYLLNHFNDKTVVHICRLLKKDCLS